MSELISDAEAVAAIIVLGLAVVGFCASALVAWLLARP